MTREWVPSGRPLGLPGGFHAWLRSCDGSDVHARVIYGTADAESTVPLLTADDVVGPFVRGGPRAPRVFATITQMAQASAARPRGSADDAARRSNLPDTLTVD